MTNRIYIAVMGMLMPALCHAQATTEKKDIRIYEHHSSSINGGAAFGIGAEGSRSGYDFVKHEHHGSFDPESFGAWGLAEIANIDMVEHQGPFGGMMATNPFGFTAATSTIWAGDIKGNDLTVYAEAPAAFDYDLATDVSYIRDAFSESAEKSIDEVEEGKVYLARIRETELYVAIKITQVRNAPSGFIPGMTVADVYYDFDYKYGTYEATSLETVEGVTKSFSIMPNPSKGSFKIAEFPEGLNKNSSTVSILDMMGRVVFRQTANVDMISTQLQAGNYLVLLSDGNSNYKSRLVIAE